MPDLAQLLLQRRLAAMHEPTLPLPPSYRADGSQKGAGFLGNLPTQGGLMSEFSISTDKFGGKDFPSLVPTLNAAELNQVLNQQMPSSVVQKAEDFAAQRQAEGKPLFARQGEQRYDILPYFNRIK